jgi:hypothetical protein
MNKGYNNKKGGFGTVNIMENEQNMLRTQAMISNPHLNG